MPLDTTPESSMETRSATREPRSHCDLPDHRAALGELSRTIAAYRSRGLPPPHHLEEERRNLLLHLSALSQGR